MAAIQQKVAPMKKKGMKLSRNDFGRRGRVKRHLNQSPKKQHNLLGESDFKLCLYDVAAALRPICDKANCILFSAFPKSACPTVTSRQDSVKSRREILMEVRGISEYLYRILNISEKENVAIDKKQ